MNTGRCLGLPLAAAFAWLAACAPQASAPSGAASTTPAGTAGVKAYYDPATGQIREPTESEARAAAVAARVPGTANVQATAPIVGVPIGNGMVEYDVGARGRVDETACVQKDGSVTLQCPPAAKAK